MLHEVRCLSRTVGACGLPNLPLAVRCSSGRATSVSDALGHTTTTTYNAAGEVLTLTDPLSHVTTMTYNVAGQTPVSYTHLTLPTIYSV